MSRKGLLVFSLLTALILAALLYVDCFEYKFTWDDTELLFSTESAVRLSAWRDAFRTPADRLYRPLRTITYATDFALGRGITPIYHATNLLLYFITCAGFLFLARSLLPGNSLAAWAATLLFAAHPLHAEVVSSIINGRADLLCAAFLFPAAALLIRKKDAKWIPLPLALFCVALLSKESAAVACGVMFFAVILRESREKDAAFRGTLVTSIATAVTFAAPAVAFFALRSRVLGVTAQTSGYHGGSLINTMLTSFSVIPDYAVELFWKPESCPIYTVAAIHGITLKASAGAFILVSAALAVVLLARRAPAVSFSIAWILLFWLPASNIIPIASLKADRFMFLSSAGACLLLGLAIARLEKSAGPRGLYAGMALAAGLLCAWCVFATRAAAPWRNDETLWRRAVVCAPNSPVAWNNHARILYHGGDLKGAETAFKNSIALSPRFPQPYRNLGDMYGAMGRYGDAVVMLRKAYQLNPADPEMAMRISYAYRKLGKDADAAFWKERWQILISKQ